MLAPVLSEPYLRLSEGGSGWVSNNGIWWMVIFVLSSVLFFLNGSTFVTWSLFGCMAGGLFLRTGLRTRRYQQALRVAQDLFEAGNTEGASVLYLAMAKDAGNQAPLQAIGIVSFGRVCPTRR